MSCMEPSGALTCPIQNPMIAGVRSIASLLPSYAPVQGCPCIWPVWAKHAVARDTFQCQQAFLPSSFCMQGHVYITKLASEPEVASSLASLCLESCMHDVLVRIPGLKDVWSRLALVTSFGGKKKKTNPDWTMTKLLILVIPFPGEGG